MKKLRTAFTLHRTKSIQSRPPENLIKTLLTRYRSLNILALFTRNFEWLSVYIFLWLGGSVWTQTLELSIGQKFVLWHVNVALGALPFIFSDSSSLLTRICGWTAAMGDCFGQAAFVKVSTRTPGEVKGLITFSSGSFADTGTASNSDGNAAWSPEDKSGVP